MYKNDSQLNNYLELKTPSINAFSIGYRFSSVGWIMDYLLLCIIMVKYTNKVKH